MEFDLGNGTITMLIVIREGVLDILEFLSEFCNFYVYSHGMKEYILKILHVLDPTNKYFKNRETSVIAPTDKLEQDRFVFNKKSVFDFKDPFTKQPLFKEDDCLIIDDQL